MDIAEHSSAHQNNPRFYNGLRIVYIILRSRKRERIIDLFSLVNVRVVHAKLTAQ